MLMLPLLLALPLSIWSMGSIGAQDPAPITITAPITILIPPGAHEPELAVDDDNHVALVCATKTEVLVAMSKDRGQHFSVAVKIGGAPALSVGMRRGPKITVRGDAVCVTVVGGERGGGKDGDVLAFRSKDGGATWTGPVTVNGIAGSAREGLHAMAQGPHGELFCAWIDLRAEPSEVFGATSTDGGATWSENRRVSNPAQRKLCPCCSPSVAYDRDGTLYVTWRGEQNGARDIVLATSRDAFATHVDAVKLGSPTWKIEMCPMDGGGVRAAGDDICVAWRSEVDVYLASTRLVDHPVSVGKGQQPALAIGLRVHVVWSEKRNGRLLVRDFGRQFAVSEERELVPYATAGVIASSPTRGKGPVIAAWETSYGDDAKVQLVRLEP